MEEISVNMNPTSWNNTAVEGTRISSLNVRSLRMHIEDVRKDNTLLQSDVIALQETWLEENDHENQYQLKQYKLHCNSQGRGKGLAIYMKENFEHVQDIRTPTIQISKIASNKMDIIVVYRSQEEKFISMRRHIQSLVNLEKTTLIIGDFNYCSLNNKNEVSKFLEQSQFKQLVKTSTHIEGAHLDQAHLKMEETGRTVMVELFSTYYSDHDMVTVLISP